MSTGTSADLYTAGSAAYLELKARILMGDVPLGVRLGEERIAARLGVSRTPVREALLRLHAERFLERHAEGGFRVTAPSAMAVKQLYEVRRALERFAVSKATRGEGEHDKPALEALHEDWEILAGEAPNPDPEFVLLDEEFHSRLAAASGNSILAEELQRVNERIRPVRSHDFLTAGRIDATIKQHLGIVRSLLDGEPQRAEVMLDAHILQSQAVVEAAVSMALEKMLGYTERSTEW